MKRFKRPISEIAKGMFHGGADGPIIPNLGVNSKKAESSSPAKIMPNPKVEDKINKPTQSQKNAEARKAGKAVSYEDAYADADMKKYGGEGGKERFIADAKAYNEKKYETENPTSESKKQNISKEQLAKNVIEKNKKVDDKKVDDKKVDDKVDDKVNDNIKSTDVVVKTKKQLRNEKRAKRLSDKAKKKGSLTKRQQRRLAIAEEKSSGKSGKDARLAAKTKLAKKEDSSPAKKHSKMKYKK